MPPKLNQPQKIYKQDQTYPFAWQMDEGRANAIRKRVRTKGWYLKTYNGRKLQKLTSVK